LWGAILGVVGGILAGPVLDLPSRLADVRDARWITLIVGPTLYYVVWLFVPVAYSYFALDAEPRGTGIDRT
jgi:hypothetical protein